MYEVWNVIHVVRNSQPMQTVITQNAKVQRVNASSFKTSSIPFSNAGRKEVHHSQPTLQPYRGNPSHSALEAHPDIDSIPHHDFDHDLHQLGHVHSADHDAHLPLQHPALFHINRKRNDRTFLQIMLLRRIL